MKVKLLLATGLIALAASSQAATLYMSGGGEDAGNCDSADAPCKTLSYALGKSAPNDTIHIAKGEYQQIECQESVLHPLTIKGGFNTNFDPQLKDADPLDTIFKVSKDAEMCRFIVVNSGTNGWVELNSLTIQDGGLASTPAHNGTILMLANYNGNNYAGNQLRLTNVVMRNNNNQAAGAAGAIAIEGGTENKLEIINSAFIGNGGVGSGGAIASSVPVDISITGTLFEGNTSSVSGGAIYLNNAAINASIDSSSFVSNTSSEHGGAIYAGNVSLSLRNNTFSANASTEGEGGGLALLDTQAALEYNTFSANSAKNSGAAIGLYGSSAEAKFLANLIVNNKPAQSSDERSIWLHSGSIIDAGYNIIGEGNVHGITDQNHTEITQTIYDANFNHKVSGNNTTVILEGSASDVLEVSEDTGVVEAEYNGAVGNQIELLTHKIKKGGAAHNAIPNDGIPFYGVGTDPANPFISLLQASATIGLDNTHYRPNKIFYFDLGGSYNEETNEFTAGSNGTLIFSAEVDADGWVRKAGLGSVGDDVETRDDNENPPREWARQVGGICSGLIATDGRGMPRSDKAKAEVSATRCDVGAFEFNDYFKLDCFDEDGDRPENNIKSFEVNWCFNPIDKDLSPQDVFENMGIGSFYWHWSLFLLAVLGFRLRVK